MPLVSTAYRRFDLQISLPTPLVAGERDFLDQYFLRVSEVLFHATQGRHQLGTVFLCYGTVGSAQADAVIVSDSITLATEKRLWNRSSGPFLYSRDRLRSVAWFVHELGHYLYDLRDEYQGPGSPYACDTPTADWNMECISDADRPVEKACLMDWFENKDAAGWMQYHIVQVDGTIDREVYAQFSELLRELFQPNPSPAPHATAGYYAGIPSDFCSVPNHDTGRHHRQNACHGGQCCWLTLADPSSHGNLDYGLVAPTGRPTLPPTSSHGDVQVVDALPTERFALLLDRSGSMAGVKISRLREGASFWVNHVDQAEQLGLISFASTSRVDAPISTVPLDADSYQSTWRTDRIGLVIGLAAAGSTAIGDALRDALDDIQTLTRAASQAIVIFSDGLQNFGTEAAEDLLVDLQATGVRLFVIGIGDDRNATLLESLAAGTGGQYLGIDSSADPAVAAAQIQAFLITAAALARNNTELVEMSSALPEPQHWPQPEAAGAGGGSGNAHRIERPIWISEGSTRGTFGAFATQDLSSLRFQLFDPADNEVTAQQANARHVPWRNGHVFWNVARPRAGRWRLVITGSVPKDARLKTFGFETNPGVRVELSLPRGRVEPGEAVRVRVRLLAPLPVRVSELRARFVESPKSFPLELSGDVDRNGDLAAVYEAEVPLPPDARGPKLLLIDVLRDEKAPDAVYPLEKICGQDDRPLAGRDTRTVAVGRIVRRLVHTVMVGQAPKEPREIRQGLKPVRAWVPAGQKQRVAEWMREFRRQ
ncbi:MAG: vWA domain-containing protein [Planctomycetota bacterium]